MIVDELLLLLSGHGVEGVEGTSELTSELAAGLNNLGHDIVTLGVSDSGSEGELSQVTANSDAGRLDEGGLFLSEGGDVEEGGVHARDVLVLGSVLVVVLHDLVEEVGEGGVRVSGAGVAANSGVDVLAAGEDASLEGDTGGVTLVVVLVPDVLSEVLADEGLGASGERGKSSEVIRGGEVVTGLAGASLASLRNALGGVAAHCKERVKFKL